MKNLFKRLVWKLSAKIFPKYEVERLVNTPGNKMWRMGIGYHAYRPFIRIDLGDRGWRFVKPLDYRKDYFNHIYPSLTISSQAQCDNFMENLVREGQANLATIPHRNVVGAGGIVVSERTDLWQKVWVKASSLLNTL